MITMVTPAATSPNVTTAHWKYFHDFSDGSGISPPDRLELPSRLILLHLDLIIPFRQPAALVVFMQASEGRAIQFHAQPRFARHGQAALVELPSPANDHVFGLPWVVRIQR